MLLTFASAASSWRCQWLLCATFVLLLQRPSTAAPGPAMYEGDACKTKSKEGTCTLQSQCPELERAVKAGEYSVEDVVSCGFSVQEEIICCPPPTPLITRLDDRPAVEACRIIDAGLDPSLSTHILGGTPVELGEYPHMAAIGYSRIGTDQGPYDFRCGGTLIDKRFVLTAAHCVNARDSQPAIVRMGVTNFTDVSQMRDVVEIAIKQVFIHPNYSSSRKYHDIAILELENAANLTATVYPTCLNTDLADPPANAPLYVTGWGTVNTKTRQFSDILLKAKLEISPLEACNESYVANGLNRQLSRGLENTQMCAHDPMIIKDACQGDSGGPLNLVVDESIKKYRIVGVVSAGFSCASVIPGLYTRVAAYLDYIESIVWPSNI